MKTFRSRIYVLMLLIFMQLPLAGFGQDFLNGICRIEEGRMIFRIDLNWTSDQVRQVSGLFDLDTVFLAKVLTGQIDSLVLADGWQFKKINNRTAEISKLLVPPLQIELDSVLGPPFSKLFLVDDAWLHAPGFMMPEKANYGVNRLTRDDAFSYSDSIARFFLPGNADARQVNLSGSFNDWSTSQIQAKRSADGWTVSLPLPPGKYQYKYIIDGRWTQDPGNIQKEDDLNGGYNSVIFCYNYRFTLKGFPEAKNVILAGSFNGFNPRELAMAKSDDYWVLDMYLRQGTHAYKFVVDGNWIADPENKVIRPDGRGNFNSFLGLGDTAWFRLKGYETVKTMILAGSFNAWSTAELKMEKVDGGWQLPYVLAPGNYEYKYIADGHWMSDSANPFHNGGGDQDNSLMAVKPNHTFVLNGNTRAKKVFISGSFNRWAKPGYRMSWQTDKWIIPLYLDPGKHTYKFMVDGKWIIDPGNELWEENEYGTGNSVLWINR